MASARYGYLTASPSDLPSKPSSTTSTSLKRPRSSSPPATSNPQIFESSPLHDRKSTFQAYFSPTLPPHDLQRLASFASASHKILAYRIPVSTALSSTKKSRQSTLAFGGQGGKEALQTGQDEDGEQYAGKHVARVLADLNVVGSLVVARWYGGVMLGPVRFKHIEDVAREAVKVYLSSLGRGQGKGAMPVTSTAGDKQSHDAGTGETEAEEKQRLMQELGERDESIMSLRKLLEQKKTLLGSLEGKTDVAETKGQPSPTRKMDYAGMDLKRLRALDQARDKTIAFLLKQIDAVEEQIVAWNALDDGVDEEIDIAKESKIKNGGDTEKTPEAEVENG
ncbi:Hypothetical protein D9617_16g013670 [Elsinoe fawcettii]|nr:Hypothetical protein D9617_16g013670 [Elsinoe fawcettii]